MSYKSLNPVSTAPPFAECREPEGAGLLVCADAALPDGLHTCHILPPSEIDLGLCLAVFAGSGGKYLFHRIG